MNDEPGNQSHDQKGWNPDHESGKRWFDPSSWQGLSWMLSWSPAKIGLEAQERAV